MKKTTVQGKAPIAVWPVCAGLAVYVVEASDERVRWRWSDDARLHSSKVRLDPRTGRAVVRAGGADRRLDEAERV